VAIRVIQWTTGNVGRRALRAIVRNPQLELVGVYAHGADKVGRDAGELGGLDERLGVVATHDIDTLIASGADACSYNPIWPDVDHLCRLLESGINVCSTAAFITGRTMGPDALARVRAATERGHSTLFGTGVNPGFANLFALLSTQICDRVDAVRVTESVDSTDYASAETEESVGYGMALDDPRLLECTRSGSVVFEEAVALIGDALGVDFDEIVFDADYGALMQISRTTGGTFYRAQDAGQLSRALAGLPAAFTIVRKHIDLASWFAAGGGLLIAAAVALSLWWNRARRKPAIP